MTKQDPRFRFAVTLSEIEALLNYFADKTTVTTPIAVVAFLHKIQAHASKIKAGQVAVSYNPNNKQFSNIGEEEGKRLWDEYEMNQGNGMSKVQLEIAAKYAETRKLLVAGTVEFDDLWDKWTTQMNKELEEKNNKLAESI